MIVVDASLVAALLLPDERTIRTDDVAKLLMASDLHAPAHFPVELASVLFVAQRRRRCDSAERARYFAWATDLDITCDDAWAGGMESVSRMADAEGLSIYDAAYFTLARRMNAPLATNDGALVAAARRHDLELITTRP